jgi:small subunit ribosomal protein S1
MSAMILQSSLCSNKGCIAARSRSLRPTQSPSAPTECLRSPLHHSVTRQSSSNGRHRQVVGAAATLQEAPASETSATDTGISDQDALSLSRQGVFEETEDLDDKQALYDVFEDLMSNCDFSFKQGDIVSGVVFEIDQKGAYIDVGFKSAAFCPTEEASLCKIGRADEVLQIGSTREFVIIQDNRKDGELHVSLKQQEYGLAWFRIRQLMDANARVTGEVVGSNRGGLIVSVGHIRGFLPGSQLGKPVDDMESMVGQKIEMKFLEVNEEEERCVFSARNAMSASLAANFQVGDVVLGTVQSVKPYGAFVDVGGGLNGLLHISQISEDRVANVETVFSVGDKLKVMILSQDNANRVALSTRKLERNKGDMLKDPQLVFDYADEASAKFKAQLKQISESRANE